MAVLNKRMKRITLGIYKVNDFSVFSECDARQRIIKVLNSKPNTDKYSNNPKVQNNFEAAWKSPVFGGPIFNPVFAARTGRGGVKETRLDGRKIEKKN